MSAASLRPVLVSCDEMRALEQRALMSGASEDALMEAAGQSLADRIRSLVPRGASYVIFAGKGHNAGDGFVIARNLLSDGYAAAVEVRLAWPEAEMRPLAQEKWRLIKDRVSLVQLNACAPAAGCAARASGCGAPGNVRLVLIDVLLGTGAGGNLRGPLREAGLAWSRIADETNAHRIAIDLPSGLDGDTGAADECALAADDTLTIGYPKQGLFADGAAKLTGRIHLCPLGGLPEPDDTAARDVCLTPCLIRSMFPQRAPFDQHKGRAGRIAILAGSAPMTGAAVLAARGALAGGGGLVSVFCPADAFPHIRHRVPDEVMVHPLHSALELTGVNADVIAAGPGLGRTPPPHLVRVLLSDPRPMVVDADALNALAASGSVNDLKECTVPRLLTPHPGEMTRLTEALSGEKNFTGSSASVVTSGRRETAVAFAASFPVTLLLKGARTVISTAGQPVGFNTTGHSVMATGGCGDVLTGLCAALIAGGCTPHQAACSGSWLLGRGAERIMERGEVFSPSALAAEIARMVQHRLLD